MSYKLWGQSGKCFCRYKFWFKNVNFVQKNWNLGRNVDFFFKCVLLLKVIIFLQNMPIFSEKCDNFDSKYYFVQWYFGQECHFPSEVYIILGMNSLEKLSNFLGKVLI